MPANLWQLLTIAWIMPQTTTIDLLLYNSVAVPASIGVLKRKSLDRPYTLFLCFLLLGFFSELIKSIPDTPLKVIRLINYLYYLTAFPLLYSSLLLWSNKMSNAKIGLGVLGIFFSICVEVYLLGLEHTKVSFVLMACLMVSIFFSLEAFVVQLSSPGTNTRIKPPLLFIVPQLVVFLFAVVMRIKLVFMFNPSTAPIFISLWKIPQYFNLAAYLCFSLGFLWAPNKEKYLTLTGP